MVKSSFELGMKISRNFDKRNEEESQILYGIILEAVEMIQNNSEHFDTAMGFITSVYEPYIKSVASAIFNNVKGSMEFCDVLQEAYVKFLQLVYKYKKEVASFSYYIKYMLPQHLYVWSRRSNKITTVAVDAQIMDGLLHKLSNHAQDDMFDYFDFKILEQDYIEFIKKRAEKRSNSDTLRTVCYKYFLGKETCSNIAQELDISYHAVYEIINKIKKELKFFLHKNMFTDFKITGSGIKFGDM
jgi:RNA polymerase sigma factor (sigma-70 family)